MESLVDVTYDAPDETMKAIDGPAFVNMNRPKSLTTYGKYCEDELFSKLKFTSQNTKRLDLVFDVNNQNSLKSQNRENKGAGMSSFQNSNSHLKIQKDWILFLMLITKTV